MAKKAFVVFDSGRYVVEPPALWEKIPGPRVPLAGKHALWRPPRRWTLRHLQSAVPSAAGLWPHAVNADGVTRIAAAAAALVVDLTR